jgi:hypothetical protein
MSTADPYPYAYVNADGTARELHANERKYLETPFKLGDGNMPYIKLDYDARDGCGEMRGYLERSKLPQDIPIQPAPAEDPSRPMHSERFAAWLRARGVKVVENKNGSLTVSKPRRS